MNPDEVVKPACPLCAGPAGELLWSEPCLRVVLADEPLNPGFTRVIWGAHVAEMTDLVAADRERLMAVVWAVERAQREVFVPDKINLASLGNQVPHLHWHVIPRWRDDPQFPQPVWAAPAAHREAGLQRVRELVARQLSAYRAALQVHLGRS